MKKQKKNTKPTTPTNKPAPKNPLLTNLWKAEIGRSHYLVAQNSEKTLQHLGENAKTSLIGLYTDLHNQCIGETSSTFRWEECQETIESR